MRIAGGIGHVSEPGGGEICKSANTAEKFEDIHLLVSFVEKIDRCTMRTKG